MEPPNHHMTDLFRQLGLPELPADISAFVAQHRPLSGHIPLADAPFWSPAQASFLREGVAQDADWAEVVDRLDASLRGSGTG